MVEFNVVSTEDNRHQNKPTERSQRVDLLYSSQTSNKHLTMRKAMTEALFAKFSDVDHLNILGKYTPHNGCVLRFSTCLQFTPLYSFVGGQKVAGYVQEIYRKSIANPECLTSRHHACSKLRG